VLSKNDENAKDRWTRVETERCMKDHFNNLSNVYLILKCKSALYNTYF